MRTSSLTRGFLFALCAWLLLIELDVHAQTPAAGMVNVPGATSLYVMSYYFEPNQAYTIQTLNLSSGADTVIHVQDYDTGHFIDGNDDCASRVNTCASTDRRSYLTVPAVSVGRIVYIIVRNYSLGVSGTATLRINRGFEPPADYSISFSGGGYGKDFTSFPTQSHFLTIEQQGGVHDTVMLVLSSASHAMEFDDDHGVGYMSWIHADEACAGYCRVIVGTYPGSSGSTTFSWDEDIHNSAKNCDSDGMSDTLESVMGTYPCDNDTDDDGILDGEEWMGVDVASNLLRFPMYGANPTYPDIFFEVDWEKCVNNPDTDPLRCGPIASQPDLDKWQMPVADAITIADTYYYPYVLAHSDIGRSNADPTTWFKYNNWGGATRNIGGTQRTADKCQWLSPDRVGYFHGVRLWGYNGGVGAYPGKSASGCLDTGYQAQSVAHESGHTLNLTHGGAQSGSPDMNCKPNYKSIMSYALAYDDTGANPTFSWNQFSSITLNPMQMNEATGMGGVTYSDIKYLTNNSFKYDIRPTGAVDWNRDGRIESGTVRAAATWGWGQGGGCGQTEYQNDSWSNSTGTRTYTTLSYMPWSGSNPRLYWFSRRDSDGKLEYRYATSFPENCGTPPSSSCRTNWYPAASSAGTLLSSSVGGPEAPSAGHYQDGSGTDKLVLVYKDTSNHLRYQVLTKSGSSESWTSPGYVGSGSDIISGSPAVIGWRGNLYVYAISGGSLKEWTLSPSGAWSGPSPQQWDENSYSIWASFGIGLARGYLAGYSNDRLFAAIPLDSPAGQLELAWKNNPGEKWNRLSDDQWPQKNSTAQKPLVLGQPGLAYEPFDLNNNRNEGRLYLAWKPFPELKSNGSCNPALLLESKGNDLRPEAVDRQFIIDQYPTVYRDVWNCANGNVALLFDLDYDRNVRGSYSANTEHDLHFAPMADGIYNGGIKDQNDYVVIKHNLMCSIKNQPSLCD